MQSSGKLCVVVVAVKTSQALSGELFQFLVCARSLEDQG